MFQHTTPLKHVIPKPDFLKPSNSWVLYDSVRPNLLKRPVQNINSLESDITETCRRTGSPKQVYSIWNVHQQGQRPPWTNLTQSLRACWTSVKKKWCRFRVYSVWKRHSRELSAIFSDTTPGVKILTRGQTRSYKDPTYKFLVRRLSSRRIYFHIEEEHQIS